MTLTLLIGTEGGGVTEETWLQGQMYAAQFTAVETGLVEEFILRTAFNANTATSLEVGIFADASGAPGALLGKTTIAGAPAKEAPIAGKLSVPVVAGTVYWLAFLALGGNVHLRFQTGSGGTQVAQSKATTFTNLETNLGGWETFGIGPLPLFGLGTTAGGAAFSVKFTASSTATAQLKTSRKLTSKFTGVSSAAAKLKTSRKLTASFKATSGLTVAINSHRTAAITAAFKAISQFSAIITVKTPAVAAGPTPPLSLRDRFPLRLVISGEDYTFLLDEDFTFSNTDPGGFEAASFPIPKDLPQIQRGDPVRLECGLAVAWEGRVKEMQRSLGNKTLIQCEGNVGKLKDAETSMVYVDRDLTRWTNPGVERRVKLAEENFSLGSEEVSVAEGLAALVQIIEGAWESPAKPVAEAWYDVGPENLVAKVYFALTITGALGSSWSQEARSNATIATITQVGENLNNSGAGATEYWTPSAARRFLSLAHFYISTPGGTQSLQYLAAWRNLTTYGNHGLTGRGPDPVGFYTSDIARHALTKCEGVKAGVIGEATQYIVPHAPYYLPVPVEQIISDMGKAAGWHWGVWESLTYLVGNQEPRLDFRPYPAPGKPTAWVWREECETLDIREDLGNLYDRAQVTFTEPGGNEGAVLVELPNAVLEAAGLHRTINISAGTSTNVAAEVFGLIQLLLLAEQANVTGSATITQAIHEMSGAAKAPWMLRAGLDRLRVPDLPCADAWGAHNDLPISRVECSGGETGLSTSVEFGMGPNLIETLNAQVQANLVAAG